MSIIINVDVTNEPADELELLGNYLLTVARHRTGRPIPLPSSLPDPVGVPVVEPIPAPVPVPPTPVTAVDTESDARGFPWDKRIHSDTKSKNNDGTWRYRRQVDKELIKKVEAELLASTPAPTPVPPPPAVAGQPDMPPPAVAGQPDMPPPPAGGEMSFDDLAKLFTDSIAAGDISNERAIAIIREVGAEHGRDLQHLGMVVANPDMIPAIAERFKAEL
jgi:hypothetical protein